MVDTKANAAFRASQVPARLPQNPGATGFSSITQKIFPLLPPTLPPALGRGMSASPLSLPGEVVMAALDIPEASGTPPFSFSIIKAASHPLPPRGSVSSKSSLCPLAYTTQKGTGAAEQVVFRLTDTYLILAPQGWD